MSRGGVCTVDGILWLMIESRFEPRAREHPIAFDLRERDAADFADVLKFEPRKRTQFDDPCLPRKALRELTKRFVEIEHIDSIGMRNRH